MNDIILFYFPIFVINLGHVSPGIVKAGVGQKPSRLEAPKTKAFRLKVPRSKAPRLKALTSNFEIGKKPSH